MSPPTPIMALLCDRTKRIKRGNTVARRQNATGLTSCRTLRRLFDCGCGAKCSEWAERACGFRSGSNDNNSRRDDRRDRLLRWQVYNGCNLLRRREFYSACVHVCVAGICITAFRKTIYRGGTNPARVCVCRVRYTGIYIREGK